MDALGEQYEYGPKDPKEWNQFNDFVKLIFEATTI
jgi:hypothetical protein